LFPTQLVLIRHAHTASNDPQAACLSGQTDIPISRRGREEIAQLQRRLLGSTPFDAIYSSPLRRAHETAAALAEIGLGHIHTCRLLQEINCGELDGCPLEQVRSRFPDLWAANLRQDDEHFRWPGGESYREFRTRCLRAVDLITRAHPAGRIALVTHAGVISQLLGHLAGARPARWARARPGTTALTYLEWGRAGAGRVICFDDRAHLLQPSNIEVP
jgi:broad specificity phosphatase PhoE